MRTALLPIFALLLLCSCFENSYLEEIPEVNLEDNFTIKKIVYTDIALGTTFIDSLSTSGKTSLLLGSYNDPIRGEISISPYFEFTIGTGIARFEDTEELDSMVLVLKYSDTHYDTMPEFGLKVWEILEDFEYRGDNDVFYQFESLATDENPILNTKVRVFPSQDSLSITIPYEFASKLFEKCKGYESILTSDSDFKDAFHGLKLQAEPNSPLIRFTTDSYVMFYYQDRKETNRYSEKYQISIGTLSKYFYHIDNTYQNSVFDGSQTKTWISSKATGGMALADQLGRSYLLVDVGDLRDIGAIPADYFLAEAKLTLPVKKGTYDTKFNKPGGTVDVYHRNKIGGYPTYITQGTMVYLDEQFQETTYFQIDLTEYINSKIRGGDLNSFLTIEIASSTDLDMPYLVFGTNSSTYQPKLEITILPLNQQL